ncbi:MAG: DUF4349 domain-containing protein [Butyrivibrio sp.]|jgi:hypothetical protein|nr:DUF4349 domain-containing protein [Butyrivibrio sp.]
MRKEFLKLVTVFAAASLVLSGCGSSSSGTDTAQTAAYQTDSLYNAAPAGAENKTVASDATQVTDDNSGAATASGNETETGNGTAQTADGTAETVKDDTARKLITTVNISAETEDLDSLLSSVNAKVKALGGYVESSSISNGNSQLYGADDTRSASLTIRIPADKLDGFVNEVQKESNITQQSRDVQDVTLNYVDTQSHQKALKAEEKQLMEIMDKASTVEDIMAVEQQLTDVRYQLESIESQLRVYDNQINYSTVYLDVQEVSTYTEAQPQDLGEKIATGFIRNLKAVYHGILNAGAWVLIHSPQLAVLAVLILLVAKAVRRHHRKRIAAKAVKETQKKQSPDQKENAPETQQEAPEKKE